MVTRLVDRMDALAGRWRAAGDPGAVFVEAYRTMTSRVGAAVEAGLFADPPWVVRLRNRFADYYFDAVDAHDCGAPCPASWSIAMECRRRADLHPLQHLFLGINAHINRDLPLTLVDVLDDWDELDDAGRTIRHDDHDAVNDVIAATIDEVQEKVIAARDPSMAVVDRALGRIDEWAIGRLIRSWRDEVWDEAVRILDGDDPEMVREDIERRAVRTARLIEF